MKKIGFTIGLMLLIAGAMAQADAFEGKKVLIRYATAHVGNGDVIENAYMAFQGDEIILLANADEYRINVLDYDTIIDAEGKHLYPGLIVMDSRLGLTEIGAVRATHDYRETGDLVSMVRAQPAFNSESEVIATAVFNGVLLAQVAPKGGLISGRSAAMHFTGWNWKEATVRADEGLIMEWPKRYDYRGWWVSPLPAKRLKEYTKKVERLDQFFEDAAAYWDEDTALAKNLRLEAMKGVLNGSERLYVRAHWAKDILDVVQFARKHNIANVSIIGGAEADLVATDLKENNISVIIDRIHQVPAHPYDPLDAPFTLASRLRSMGLEVAFATAGGMEAMISRNLPFQVGTAVSYGMDYEDALRSATLVPAMLMGIDKNYGTIESGKNATFLLCNGDLFDMRSNTFELVVSQGKLVDLVNRQQQLYERYRSRFGL